MTSSKHPVLGDMAHVPLLARIQAASVVTKKATLAIDKGHRPLGRSMPRGWELWPAAGMIGERTQVRDGIPFYDLALCLLTDDDANAGTILHWKGLALANIEDYAAAAETFRQKLSIERRCGPGRTSHHETIEQDIARFEEQSLVRSRMAPVDQSLADGIAREHVEDFLAALIDADWKTCRKTMSRSLIEKPLVQNMEKELSSVFTTGELNATMVCAALEWIGRMPGEVSCRHYVLDGTVRHAHLVLVVAINADGRPEITSLYWTISAVPAQARTVLSMTKAEALIAVGTAVRTRYGIEPLIRAVAAIEPGDLEGRREELLPAWRVLWSQKPFGAPWIFYASECGLTDCRAEGLECAEADQLQRSRFTVYQEQSVEVIAAPFRDDLGPAYEVWVVIDSRRHGRCLVMHAITGRDPRESYHDLSFGDLIWTQAARADLPDRFHPGWAQQADAYLIHGRRFDEDLRGTALSILASEYDRKFHKKMHVYLIGSWTDGRTILHLLGDGSMRIETGDLDSELGRMMKHMNPDSWNFAGSWKISVMNSAEMTGGGLSVMRSLPDELHLVNHHRTSPAAPLACVWRRISPRPFE